MLTMSNISNYEPAAVKKSPESFPIHTGEFSLLVSELIQQFICLWWSCDGTFPVLEPQFTPQEQSNNENRLKKMVDGLIYEIKHLRHSPEERQASQSRLHDGLIHFADDALHMKEDHLNFIEESGMLESLRIFAEMARIFDPNISAEDIYQAGTACPLRCNSRLL